MNIKLYPCFNHWKEYNNIWLYSDPHFNDPEQIFLRPNYISDEEQIKKINSKVGKKDLLIILGDIGDISFISKLRGYKVLITGNHDVGNSKYLRSKTDEFDNHLFDEVYDGPLFIAPKLLISHEPIDYPYALNIHGHDHSQRTFQDSNHLNLCAELINYIPISLTDIIKSGVLNKIDNIHRSTIDKASLKKGIK